MHLLVGRIDLSKFLDNSMSAVLLDSLITRLTHPPLLFVQQAQFLVVCHPHLPSAKSFLCRSFTKLGLPRNDFENCLLDGLRLPFAFFTLLIPTILWLGSTKLLPILLQKLVREPA